MKNSYDYNKKRSLSYQRKFRQIKEEQEREALEKSVSSTSVLKVLDIVAILFIVSIVGSTLFEQWREVRSVIGNVFRYVYGHNLTTQAIIGIIFLIFLLIYNFFSTRE
ncbi:MAG: hypothetical protein PHE89_05445 [Alphaproteobacteria bacterium]|nr:hypothetical protein [Alphaproteobacteria bacterium]